MDFLGHIVEKENKFLAEVKRLEEEGNPIYIYGSAAGGKQVANRLLREGINYEGMVEDSKYWKESSGAQRLEDVLEQAEGNVSLVIAFKGFQGKKQIPYSEKISHIVDWDCWAGNHEVEGTYITYGWVVKNESRLQGVCQRLADEKSKETFVAYLNQKISFDYKYTTLQLFHKKNVIQDFLMYNKFANKKIRKKVILYDKLIIQRKNYNW